MSDGDRRVVLSSKVRSAVQAARRGLPSWRSVRAGAVLATGAISAAGTAFVPAKVAGAAAGTATTPARIPTAAPAPAPVPPASPAVASNWSFVGPQPLQAHQNGTTNNRPATGRVTSLAVSTGHPEIIYAGSAGAGVWKSTDSGKDWSPTMHNEASLAIGALAIDPNTTDPNSIVYAGTGEINGSDSQLGQGILKSVNGGTTWTLMGQSDFADQYVGGLVVDKADSKHVLAATSTGLWQSHDSGSTWKKDTELAKLIEPIGKNTPSDQVFEIHQDPSQSNTIVASFGDKCITEQGGIATSNNRGVSWGTKPTFVSSSASRIGVGLGPGGRGYAAVASCKGKGGSLASIQQTFNHAGAWTLIPATNPGYFNYFAPGATEADPQAQGGYDNAVAVDPTNADNAVFGGVSSMATTTGGKSFFDNGKVYTGGFVSPDFHAFAFTGATKSFYIGNDGGMWSTTDMGGMGTSSDYTDLNTNGLQLIQFVAGIDLDSHRILGGTQDNGSPGFFDTPGAALPTMAEYNGGDGAVTAIDPTPGATTIYTENPKLSISRGNRLLQGSTTNVGPCMNDATDSACKETSGPNAPYVMDPTNPARLVAGAQRVYQTLNGGGANGGATSWSRISDNLTTKALAVGAEDFLTSVALGPKGGNTIFTTSREGRVSRTTNGTSWTNITGNLPGVSKADEFLLYEFMQQVAFNPANPAEAWVTMSSSNLGRLWHTVNARAAGGTQWTDISGTGQAALPSAPVQTVAEDPVHPGTIYVGTAYGAWVCTTCGGSNPSPSWHRIGLGLPNVQVDKLTFTADQSRLVAWTHGWGLWELPLPATMPGIPTGVYASPGDSAATVSWTQPPANRITGYTVTASPGGKKATVAGTATSATVGDLTNGTSYTFTVAATNNAGTGSSSVPSNPVTPPGAPVATSPQFGVPNQTDVFKVADNGAVTVSWVDGAGTWNGPLPISSPGLARPGARLAVSPQFGVPNQTDVFVVSNNEAINVLWVQGAGKWNGPLAISPAGLAPPGAGLVASPQFGVANQTDVFVVGNDGTTQVVWVVGAGTWKLPLALTPAGQAAPGAGLATSPQFGVANQTDVFRVNNKGAIEVVWVQGAGIWKGPLGIVSGMVAPPGAGVAASPQFGVPNQTDVFSVADNGATAVVWVQGAGVWKGPLPIGPSGMSPPGSPLAAFPQLGAPNQTDVFQMAGNGSTEVAWVEGAGKWNGPLGISPDGLSPAGEALAASPQFGVPNQTDVFFIADVGNTRVVWVPGTGIWNGPIPIGG